MLQQPIVSFVRRRDVEDHDTGVMLSHEVLEIDVTVTDFRCQRGHDDEPGFLERDAKKIGDVAGGVDDRNGRRIVHVSSVPSPVAEPDSTMCDFIAELPKKCCSAVREY